MRRLRLRTELYPTVNPDTFAKAQKEMAKPAATCSTSRIEGFNGKCLADTSCNISGALAHNDVGQPADVRCGAAVHRPGSHFAPHTTPPPLTPQRNTISAAAPDEPRDPQDLLRVATISPTAVEARG
jgi:hypothetical protein